MTITVNREYNVHYNKKRIRRLMQILHLKSVCRRKRYNYIQSTPEVTAENISSDISIFTTTSVTSRDSDA